MAGSGQRARGESSDGRRIDDHSFWAGKASNGSVFPMGAKTKMESSAEGAGSLMNYEDKTEDIRAAQVEATKKAKSHQGRLSQYRN